MYVCSLETVVLTQQSSEYTPQVLSTSLSCGRILLKACRHVVCVLRSVRSSNLGADIRHAFATALNVICIEKISVYMEAIATFARRGKFCGEAVV